MWYNELCVINLNGMAKTTRKRLNALKNSIAFQNVFNKLLMDGLSRYEFSGLPETINERVLLQSLLWYGGACVFEYEGSLLCLPAVPTGAGFNIYGEPSKVWVFSKNNGYNKEVDVYIHGSDESTFLLKGMGGTTASKNAKGVYIRENALAFPFVNQTVFYASAIADTMRTLDTARANIKNPYIIVCEESVKDSVERYFKQRDNNDEFIISSGVFDARKVNLMPIVTNTEALNECTALVEWYENKYRELCGIENSTGLDKKGENLISAELNVNNDQTKLNPKQSLQYIQTGLNDVNKLFGTNITVDRRTRETTKDDESEGGENETI